MRSEAMPRGLGLEPPGVEKILPVSGRVLTSSLSRAFESVRIARVSSAQGVITLRFPDEVRGGLPQQFVCSDQKQEEHQSSEDNH